MSETKPERQTVAERVFAPARDVVEDFPAFARYVVRRFIDDQGLQTAASLTYTSLLGLVPLVAVFLAILGAFPAFAELRADVQATILAPFAPGAGAAVQEHLNAFLENTKRLGVLGALGIGVTAILMLNTIETTLNNVWRVAERRSFRKRLLIFWALLTVPPILIAASLSLTSYFYSIAGEVGAHGAVETLNRLTPFVMQAVAFTILFIATPNRRVRLRDAAIGGGVAAVLFEGLKNLFGVYVASATSQEAIYGALAAIPFFLLWLYATWTMILIGAEIAAALPEWKGALAAERRRRLSSGERLTAAIGILTLLWRRNQAGRRVEREQIDQALPADSADLGAVLERLIGLDLVAVAEAGHLVLARDLDEITVYSLQRDLGLALEETPRFRRAMEAEAPGLAVPALGGMMAAVESAKADIMSATIKSLAAGRTSTDRPSTATRAAGDWRKG